MALTAILILAILRPPILDCRCVVLEYQQVPVGSGITGPKIGKNSHTAALLLPGVETPVTDQEVSSAGDSS